MTSLAFLYGLVLCLSRPALRAAAGSATFLRPQTHAGGPIVLPLSRRVAKLEDAGESTLKSFYIGTVRVGTSAEGPQEMLVFFDTGSGQVILDSTRCSAPACLRHRRYAADAQTAVSVNTDGRPVPRGSWGDVVTIGLDTNDVEPGKVTGNFVRDTVCLGTERGPGSSRAEACAELVLVAATNMTAQPFAQAPFDGIVGLGLEGLSIAGEYSFFGRLRASAGLLPHFAIFVPPGHQDGRAEITFGGHNAARLASPLAWVPVVKPEDGFWQVAITSLEVGGRQLSLCGDGCRGVVDSSSSHLGVPEETLEEFEAALVAGGVECSDGPELRITLEGGVVLALTAGDYSRREGTRCRPQVHPLLDADRQKAGRQSIDKREVRSGGLAARSFVLGEPVLRRYYTVYDWDAKRVGFGRAAGMRAARAAESESETAEAERTPHTEEFILMQCKSELKRNVKPAPVEEECK